MTTQAAIQAKIFQGYGKAAAALGAPFQVFRPTGSSNPLSGAALATVLAAFDQSAAFSFKQPSGYAKPVAFGLFDGTAVEVGDYLTNATQGTYFVAGYEPMKPMLCVVCNRTLTFTRPSEIDSTPGTLAVGYTPIYGGRVSVGNTTGGGQPDMALLTSWPASCLQGTKGEANPPSGRLPSDVRAPWWAILLPAYPGVILHSGDRVQDDLGRVYVVSSAELTGLGWRCTAIESQT